MSVQVRRRREAASFLSTYVGAQGELLVDTTNNRVQVHDGSTPGGWPAAKLADVIGRTAIADAAYVAKTTDRMIALVALTAARTITLPSAAAYPTGTALTIIDESGACATIPVTIAAAGTDTINGLATWPIATGYGYAAIESNGAGRWTVVDSPGTARTALADASYAALATDRIVAFTALTAARTVTLPASAAYPTGTQLLVVDETGACSFALPITIARAGSDTIGGAASAAITAPYGFLALASNGAGKWTIVDFTGATIAQLTNRNVVLNGNFAVNQRNYASGASLAAGAYGHDRFKAGAGGCTYTFTPSLPDTTVTLTAGTMIQAVEAANVTTGAWWLTWTGTATARLWQGSASGLFSAGIAMTIGGIAVNALLVTGLVVGTTINIEFQGGAVGLVQLEAALPNAGPTRFERRFNELVLCQRYFQTCGVGLVGQITGGNAVMFGAAFGVPMRAAPTVSVAASFSAATGPGVTSLTSASVSFANVSAAGMRVNVQGTLSGTTTVGAPLIIDSSNVFQMSAEL